MQQLTSAIRQRYIQETQKELQLYKPVFQELSVDDLAIIIWFGVNAFLYLHHSKKKLSAWHMRVKIVSCCNACQAATGIYQAAKQTLRDVADVKEMLKLL